MNIQLLIIDPQNDFCWPGIDFTGMDAIQEKLIRDVTPPEVVSAGTLYVPGAFENMKRTGDMIIRLKKRLDDIHVTEDSHHYVDVAHPIFLINSKGKHPDPFTIITEDDIRNGVWRATNPQFQDRLVEYVTTLTANGRYPLCVWPPHCLIGTFGHGVVPPLADALLEWEKDFAMVDYVTKGSNFWTEHYSAVQADVPDPEDPTTQKFS